MFDAAKLRSDLVRDEGFRAVVYDDASGLPLKPGQICHGHPTIGIGWALDVNPLSRERANTILQWHIDDKTTELFAALPWARDLDEVRCRALVNMAFNLGVTKLQTFVSTLAALREKRWSDAAASARKSLWYTQVGARAERICKAFETGADPAPAIA